MNRKERRKIARIRSDDSETLVPVFCNFTCLERVGPERLHYLLKAKNVKPVYRHRDRKIVELQVQSFSHDEEGKPLGEGLPSQGGNASTYTHTHETDENPPRVITFRDLDPRFWMPRRRYRKAS
jgi:hypothetical protein